MVQRDLPPNTDPEDRSCWRPDRGGGADDPVDIDIEELGPPPVGAPVDFRERLALALKTTDPAVLRDAEAAYRGVYDSEHAYIVAQVAEYLQPPDMSWLLACCDPDRLREGYEGRALVVWSIALDHGACMVFESVRESPDALAALVEVELDDGEVGELDEPGAREDEGGG